MNIQDILNEIIIIAKDFGAKEVWLFGSRARGTNRPESDIDIAVDYCKNIGKLKFRLNEEIHTLKSINPVVIPKEECKFKEEILNGRKIFDYNAEVHELVL